MLSVLVGCILLTQGIIAMPVENDEFRNFGSPKNYFSNFDVESLNPFNWLSGNRNAVNENEADDKFDKFFKIIECLANAQKDCSSLVDEAKPYFVKKTKTKTKTTTAANVEETPRSETTTDPTSATNVQI